jgi:menaquinone reductase, molybdopterin-binding-like subunit
VAHTAAYADMRQARRGIRGSLVQVEPRMSQTGASADEWVPVRPGREGALALAIAHVLMASHGHSPAVAGAAGQLIDGWTAGLPEYTPARVEEITGVPAARITRLSGMFAEASAAVAMIGGAPLAHTNGLFNALAVNALNALVGAVGRPGGVLFTPMVPAFTPASWRSEDGRQLEGVATALLTRGAGAPQIVVVDGGANPVFTAPPAWRVREALEQVPFLASFSSFLDETTALADLILPDHSFLESWVDAVPESGAAMAVVSVAPPVMKPLHNTRAMPDVLLAIARGLQPALDAVVPWLSYEAMLEASLTALTGSATDDAWEVAQEQGGWWGDVAPAATRVAPRKAGTLSVEPTFDGDPHAFPFYLLPYPSMQFLDGSTAHLPWLQEMPDPLTSAMWSSWVELNPVTAARIGVSTGDLLEIASSAGTLQAAAVLTPGIAPDVAAMPLGQGHTCFTRYATGRGVNPAAILAPMTEPVTGAVAWAATRVRITRIAARDGRLILFAGGDREHPYQELGRG